MNEILQGILTWHNFFSLIAFLIAWILATIYVENQVLAAINEAVKSIRDATHKESPGGEKITKAEAEVIVKRVLDVLWLTLRKKLGFLKVFTPKKLKVPEKS